MDGRAKVSRPREQDALHKETHTENQGTAGDSSDVASKVNELENTNKEGLEAEVTETIGMGLLSNAEYGSDEADPMQVVSVDVGNGPQNPNTKATWTRLRRKVTEPQEVNKETKPVLGKRSTNKEGSNQVEGEHVERVKRGKRSMKSNSKEAAGVSMHLCRSQ